jgi:hypothetical protein
MHMGSHPETRGGAHSDAVHLVDRRAQARFPFPGGAACCARPLDGDKLWPARGIDVSPAGLALRLTQAPAAGQILVIELWRTDWGLFLTRLLRVAYALPMSGGGYRVGGEFVQELDPCEFGLLLGRPGAGDLTQ